MHANTALPCAWALGTLLVLTGCASHGHSKTHPLDLPVTPPIVASARPPALRAPSPPSLLLLAPDRETDGPLHAVPLGRDRQVQPALAAPVDRSEAGPAPCALSPETTLRHPVPRTRPRLRRQEVESPCAGGT